LQNLTNAPSSGKSTVLRELETRGFKVINEVARTYIDEELKKGNSLDEIRGKDKEAAFQEKVLELKIELEKTLRRNEITFFERGIPDSYAYAIVSGLQIPPKMKYILNSCKYKKVFLFERLDFQKDYARIEDEHTAQQLQELLESTYSQLTFPVVKVPKMNVQQRVDFILQNLS